MKNTIAIFINIVILIASLFTSTNYSIADTQTYNQTEISSDVGMYSYESSDEKNEEAISESSQSIINREETDSFSSSSRYIYSTESTSRTSEANSETEKTNVIQYDTINEYPSNRSDLNYSSKRNRSNVTINSLITPLDKNPGTDFIDVSSHNGPITVEQFKKIKSYGIKAVIVKVTEYTTYINPYARAQISNARAAGMRVGGYHYSWYENETEARAEANYFAKNANDVGLTKADVMINDLEENSISANSNHTKNAQAFENQLKLLGYSNIQHYIGLNWINSGLINPRDLGEKKIWVAAYPYTVTDEKKYQQYSAWQWTSQMSFPDVPGVFDVSVDYENKISGPPQGIPLTDNRYVTITKKGYNLWSNFNWDKRNSTDNLYNQTFESRVKYNHINGSTYLSLYDFNGVWKGYLNTEAVQVAAGKQGIPLTDNRYVTITKKGYNLWSNFNWDKRNSTDNLYNQTFESRVKYNHINGSTYLSLYDFNGVWKGYLNTEAVQVAAGKQGIPLTDNRYVTITKKGYNLWSNFNWDKRNSTDNLYNQTFESRVKYNHINGSTYLSLYDFNGVWKGYLNTEAVQVAAGKQGIPLTDNRYVTITKKGYNLWSNFNWDKRNSTDNLYNQTFESRVKYNHINGSTYLSLYDFNGVWKGYLNAEAINIIIN